jgi:hypothetical protein
MILIFLRFVVRKFALISITKRSNVSNSTNIALSRMVCVLNLTVLISIIIPPLATTIQCVFIRMVNAELNNVPSSIQSQSVTPCLSVDGPTMLVPFLLTARA